jgi:unsaturated rhamnogalacturonyl hydrolase
MNSSLKKGLHFCLSVYFFCTSGQLFAQEITLDADIKTVRKVADRILENATFDFVTRDKTRIIKKLNENDTINAGNLLIRSPYNAWTYWNGVLNISMLRLFSTLKDDKYKSFALKNYDFAFDNASFFKKKYTGMRRWDIPFITLFTTELLDDCGAEGAGLIEANAVHPRADFKNYIDSTALFIMDKQLRLNDGTLARSVPRETTLWADDLYMGVVFLSRVGSFTGNSKYFDDAIRQVVNVTNYLYNPATGLYYHCWYSNANTNGVAHWGRCNGWIMMAMVELLNYIPENHPQREKLIQILRQHIIGVSRYQDISGMWHQLLNKNDSYLETSCTAMFTYGIAKAVNMGWVEKSYITIALEGWKGVKKNILADGQVKNICMGTGIQEDLVYYYTRPTPLNDIHGLGATLLAGDEIIKYKRNVVPE